MKSMPLRKLTLRTSSRRRGLAQSSGSRLTHTGLNRDGLALLSAPHDIVDAHLQCRVDGFDLDGVDLDRIAQVLLQVALDHELHRGRELRAVPGEDELLQAAAEIRPIHALTRPRQQKLFDQIANVIIFVVAAVC